MTDTTVAPATDAPLSKIVAVNVTKAKANLEVDVERLPDAEYTHVIAEGLKARVNSGMTSVTKAKCNDDPEKVKELALKIARENIEKMYAGTLKAPGRASASSDKVPGAVMTEARRLCKEVIKTEIKAAGLKISHVDPKKITEAANEMLKNPEVGPTYIAQAEKNLAARGKLPGASSDSAQAAAKLASLGVGVDPARAAKVEAEAAKRKQDVPLSAKQAGMTAARAQSATAH